MTTPTSATTPVPPTARPDWVVYTWQWARDDTDAPLGFNTEGDEFRAVQVDVTIYPNGEPTYIEAHGFRTAPGKDRNRGRAIPFHLTDQALFIETAEVLAK